MPADQRPELYVYGESLGAFSTDNAFTSVEDMSTTTDGALLVGPPSFDATWQKVVAGRAAGSPVWKPIYGDGALVRVATTEAELTDQTLTWRTDNPIIYLTHASDPIVAWTADHAAWLDPRGPDVSPAVVAWPVVAGWQATVDQFNANGVPAGHGHVYDETVVTAWSEIVGPPSLPDAEIAAIEKAISWPAPVRRSGIRNRASGCGVVEPMTTPGSDMAERYERARGLFEHGEYQAAAEALATLVDESALEPPLHGTTELRLLLARSYFHSAQLGRAERVTRAILADVPDDAYANLLLGRTLQRQGRHAEAKPHLAMAELLGGYAGSGRLPRDGDGARG